MSTVHISQALTIPKHLHPRAAAVPRRPLRTQRTEISTIYQHNSNEKTNHKNNPSTKHETTDGDILSLDLLNQYNEIVGPTDCLAFKRLPPVKVSYQSTKHKFVESPHIEGTSRIIRPHLSMKTYSPGHHIFTEGISKSSMVRSPTFALQQVGVPYSNLPDNISIYKEKDKFAFGVKDGDYEKSPYRLTPKPFKVGSATFIPALEFDPGKSNTESERFLKAKRGSKANLDRPYIELKSNVIKLEPLAIKEEKDGKHGIKNKSDFNTDVIRVPAGYTRPARSPVAPSNSFYLTETVPEADNDVQLKEIKETDLEPEEKTLKLERHDRKLSVVSIGETVGPDFYDSRKRETRQQYPIYDNTARKNENYRRKKFEYSDDFILKAKPHVSSSAFTYKVSMQGMAFLHDKPAADMFKPIRNNLRDKHGNVIHKQRGLGRYISTSREEETTKNSSDYNFRRYYRRVFRRPKSSDSHSTEFSQVPGNPPPSEISHILSEDGPILVNDVRNGMLTLVEERTMTASNISPRKENTPVVDIKDGDHATKEITENDGSKLTNRTQTDTETCTDTDVQFENALRTIERYNEQEIESSRTELGKNTGVDSSASLTEKSKEMERARSVNENSSKCDSSVVEQYIAEAEERIKNISASEDIERKPPQALSIDLVSQSTKTAKLDTIDEHQANKKNCVVKSKSNKQILAVPTLSLDTVSYNPLFQMSKERTSLSRSIQNMTIPDEIIKRNVTKVFPTLFAEKGEDIGLNVEKEYKTALPVTRLRLFSDTSTVSLKGSSIDLTVENEDVHGVLDSDLNDSKATDQCTKEKKVISNANISFIYPSTSEIKAKRQ